MPSKGQFKFGTAKQQLHSKHFRKMIARAKNLKLKIDFKSCQEDFKKFVELIGPVPKKIKRLSVGRLDHSLGYIAGNFEWQELSENDRESAIRVQPWKYISKRTYKIAAAKRRGQKRTPEQRKQMSQAQKGRTFTEAARKKMSISALRPSTRERKRRALLRYWKLKKQGLWK